MANETKKIIISGASGFVGTPLVAALRTAGHTVLELTRSTQLNEHQRHWQPSKLEFDHSTVGAVDVVINLAGEPLVGGRWTDKKKQKILASRVNSTSLLADYCAQISPAPKLFLSASAIGFYGDRDDEVLSEESSIGAGFLAETCKHWEDATAKASAAGVSTAHMRFGVILDPSGGALKQMLPAFSLGGGGKLGSGQQWMSWIALDDVIAAILYCIESNLSGTLNFTAPEPVRNATFTKALGKALRRPTFFTVPRFVLKTIFGQMAEEALLASAKVLPKRLEESGFEFSYKTIEEYLNSAFEDR